MISYFMRGLSLKTQRPFDRPSVFRKSNNMQGFKKESNSCCSPRNLAASMSTLSNDQFCRICRETAKEEELFLHCQCKGTVGLTHTSCLLSWIKKSGSVTCELCKERYSTIAELNKRFWQWNFPRVGTKGWLKFVFFVAFLSMLIAFTAWLIWSRLSSSPKAQQERNKRQVEYSYIVYGMLVLIAFVGIYASNLRPCINYVSKCLVINQNIVVIPIPKGELWQDESGTESWDQLDITRSRTCGSGSRSGSCKHDMEKLKDTCVQVQGSESTGFCLNRYIKLGGGDITMV